MPLGRRVRRETKAFVRCGAPLVHSAHFRGHGLFCLARNLEQCFFVANGFRRAWQFQFELRVRDRVELFAGWQSDRLFSMPVSDDAKYDCLGSARWAQYEEKVHLLVRTPLILSYYTGLSVPFLPDDLVCVWAIGETGAGPLLLQVILDTFRIVGFGSLITGVYIANTFQYIHPYSAIFSPMLCARTFYPMPFRRHDYHLPLEK